MRFGRIFFVIVLLACIFETVRLWTITPAQMASHFDIAGNPNRFDAKEQFFGFEIEIMLVVIGMGVIMQIVVLITPVEWVNLRMPNREYWLMPEHRDELTDRMSSFAGMLFGTILLGIQAGFELAVSANLHQPIVFNAGPMWAVIAGLFVVDGLLLFRLMISFRVPRSRA